ncbi:hypothetical protein [Polycladidibacter stylochi]|uniref:hypothetical protein n=1 Tax=Polycladidibacter stylochi TaxID=1807766 RepID=UPI000829CA43|nr:hypothetical protein [Pseudovibrio stylochi]
MTPTKSAWASKINWTATIGALAAVATVFGIDIDPALQAKIAASISAVSGVAVVIWRTWFTSKKIG